MAESLRPSMVGRIEEMELLLGWLSKAIDEKGSLILIAGEAGIGKTRLAEEFEYKARTAGCMTLIGRCLPGSPVPLLPFQEAMSQFHYSESPRRIDLAGENGRPFDVVLDADQQQRIAGRDKPCSSELTLLSIFNFIKDMERE